MPYDAHRRRGTRADDYLCRLCKESPAAWDHCHEHGYVRGPRCGSCNTRASTTPARWTTPTACAEANSVWILSIHVAPQRTRIFHGGPKALPPFPRESQTGPCRRSRRWR
ncbi:endonuclease domain-containing protein [Streptomyces violaceorubidus]